MTIEVEEIVDKLVDLVERRLDDIDIPLDADELEEVRCTLDSILSKYEGE